MHCVNRQLFMLALKTSECIFLYFFYMWRFVVWILHAYYVLSPSAQYQAMHVAASATKIAYGLLLAGSVCMCDGLHMTRRTKIFMYVCAILTELLLLLRDHAKINDVSEFTRWTKKEVCLVDGNSACINVSSLHFSSQLQAIMILCSIVYSLVKGQHFAIVRPKFAADYRVKPSEREQSGSTADERSSTGSASDVGGVELLK